MSVAAVGWKCRGIRTLLGQEETVSLFEGHSVAITSRQQLFSRIARDPLFIPRVLVIRREARRVSRLCDFSRDDFLESVQSLAVRVEGVHEMHDSGVRGLRIGWFDGFEEAVQMGATFLSSDAKLKKTRKLAQTFTSSKLGGPADLRQWKSIDSWRGRQVSLW